MALQKLSLTVDVASQGLQILTNFIWSGQWKNVWSNVGFLKLLMRVKFVELTKISPLHTLWCKLTNQLVKATEAELLWLSGRANGVAFGRNCWCAWSLYKRRTRSMWTAVMFCFILLKSGNYAIIVRHYALIISFVIGFELVTKFAMGRSSGVSCGRFDEIRREISMKA